MSIITIAGGEKGGVSALASSVAERLGYQCLGREILIDSTRKYNIEEETLQAEMNHAPGFWQRLRRERHRYLVFVRCSLLQAAKRDNIVYLGHVGQVFLEGIGHVLKVRVEVPLDRRIQSVMEEKGLNREQAHEHIEQLDDERRRWMSFLYNRKWGHPSYYDLTLNMANMSVETAGDLICCALGRPEFQPSPKSIQKLYDLALECEVLAALAADDDLWELPLRVSAVGGTVAVHGNVKNRHQTTLIEQLVPKVKGVSKYDICVNLLSDPLPGGAPWRD